VIFYKILIQILHIFDIDFMTTGDFLLKFQDWISYNNLLLYFEIDKISFEDVRDKLVWEYGIQKQRRFY